MMSRGSVVYDLKLLFRDYIWFKVVVGFVVLKSIRSGSLRWVARHTGMDVRCWTLGQGTTQRRLISPLHSVQTSLPHWHISES